ncbi:hypothetical protein RHECNPAF_2940049 [Rhizobium etli CNPAF512]|nr:hypothetical protein RHECNPAF_2940049 [Rhizobium etli CNPAF512]
MEWSARRGQASSPVTDNCRKPEEAHRPR